MAGGPLHEQYFDPIALIAEDVMVPVEFQFAVKSLGRLLQPCNNSADLRKDARTELPLWLAKALTERHITRLSTPPVYGEWMQRRVDAGAACISLRQHPYFYSVGMQCASIMADAGLASFLRSTFSQRSRALLAGCLKAPDGPALQRVVTKLDQEEKQLYEAGRQGAARQEAWWAAGGHTPLLLSTTRHNAGGGGSGGSSSGGSGVKRRRTTTAAAGDKENLVGA